MLIGVLAQNFSTQTPVKENYSAVAEFLTKNAKAEDIIAISPPFTVYPIEYNYHGFAKIDTIPNWDRYQFGGVPAFKDTDLQQQILKYKQVYHKLFVVLSYDQGYEKKIRMLLDKGYAFEKSYTFSDKLEVRQYVLRYDIAAK